MKILAIHKGNLENVCGQKIIPLDFTVNRTKPLNMATKRVFCVISLSENIKNFRQFVMQNFETEFMRKDVEIQYANINLKQNLDLNRFLKKELNIKNNGFLLYASDTEMFKILPYGISGIFI